MPRDRSRDKKGPFYRSARACPSRALLIDRSMARHRTAPYGLRGPFHYRAKEAPFTVARGPVPRDLPTEPKTPETPGLRHSSLQTDARRGTGPRPTDEGAFHRSAKEAPFHRSARENPAIANRRGFPSRSPLIDRCMARHRTTPYGLRAFSPRQGAAQARALRGELNCTGNNLKYSGNGNRNML